MKKAFLIIAIVVVVVLVIISTVAGFYLGPIVKMAMEQIGPKVTKVSVKVDNVDLSLITGSVKLKGLVVGNPPGFKTPQAISVGTVAVSVAPMSVFSPKIVVHSINVESPEITFEGVVGGNNLSKIVSNVNSQNNNPQANTVSTSPNAPAKPAPKIEVDDFAITGAKVHVNLPGLGIKTLSLPDIHLTDLGKGSDGLTPEELTRAVLSAISSDTIKAVASSATDLTRDVRGLSQGTLSKITSSLSGILGGK